MIRLFTAAQLQDMAENPHASAVVERLLALVAYCQEVRREYRHSTHMVHLARGHLGKFEQCGVDICRSCLRFLGEDA